MKNIPVYVKSWTGHKNRDGVNEINKKNKRYIPIFVSKIINS